MKHCAVGCRTGLMNIWNCHNQILCLSACVAECLADTAAGCVSGTTASDGSGSADVSRVLTRAQAARQREHTGSKGQGEAMSEDDGEVPEEAVHVGEVVGGEDNMDEDSEPIQEGSVEGEEEDDLDSVSEEDISDEG